MNSRERILTALSNGQPDRVPVFELYINEPSIVKLAKLLKPEKGELETVKDRFGEERREIIDLYCLIVEELELDATCWNFSTGLEALDDRRALDRYGTLYALSDHGEPVPIRGAIEEPGDAKGFDMVSRLRPEDFEKVRYIVESVGKEKAHFVSITDPYKVSWRLRGGMQNLLLDYALNPRLVHNLARIATDFDIAAIDLAVEAGIDVMIMPGDLAGEEATIISPDHYREYLKPYHREIVDHAHRRGAKMVKHSDGDIWPILDDLIEVGFDGIHPIQPQCMDIAEVKRHVAGKACVLGNIDCRDLLPSGSPEQVERVVQETIDQAAPGGGYVLSSSNSIHPGCRPENYIAMVRAARKYGATADIEARLASKAQNDAP